METAKILRELWRRRLLVSVIATMAIASALMLTHRPGLPPQSRQHQVGVASARILVDTPQSQFVEVDPLGAGTLGQRANLLSTLMAEGEAKAAIARRAGLAPTKLSVIADSAVEGASPKEAGTTNVFILTTHVVRDSEGVQLPIIELEAEAPDTAAASKLATAAVDGLKEYLDSKAAGEKIADRRRLHVSGLGVGRAQVEIRGPGLVLGAAAGIFVFLAGCGIVLLISSISRSWREVDAYEQGEPAASDVDQPPRQAPTIIAIADTASSSEVRAPARRARARPDWGAPEQVMQVARDPGARSESAMSAPPHDEGLDQPSASRAQPHRLRRGTLAKPGSGSESARSAVTKLSPAPAETDVHLPDAGAGR